MTPDLGRFPHHPLLALDGIIPFQRGHCCRPKGQLSNNASKCYCGQATLRGKSLKLQLSLQLQDVDPGRDQAGAIACQRPALEPGALRPAEVPTARGRDRRRRSAESVA
jgi:hypothetical protein